MPEKSDKPQKRTPGQGSGVASGVLVYDGQCPFCSWYVEQLSEHITFDALNAREDPDIVADLRAAGVDINRDIALIMDGQILKGAQALFKLSSRNVSSDGCSGCMQGRWFHRLHSSLFGWRALGVTIYPVLRGLRRIYLRISKHPDI